MELFESKMQTCRHNLRIWLSRFCANCSEIVKVPIEAAYVQHGTPKHKQITAFRLKFTKAKVNYLVWWKPQREHFRFCGNTTCDAIHFWFRNKVVKFAFLGGTFLKNIHFPAEKSSNDTSKELHSRQSEMSSILSPVGLHQDIFTSVLCFNSIQL